MTKKKYKNKTHRMLNDMYWDGSDDGHEYTGPKRLSRNKIDGVLGGVCAGFGDYVGLDHTIVRVLFVLSVIFLGLPFFVYFLLWIFIPKDTRAPYRREYNQARRAYRESPTAPIRTTTFKDVKSKYRSLETRMQDLEQSITSKEWKLRRDFRDLES
ncbi:phage shock protein C (PspC) family protein [Litorimonas taeanensis]|uniref:Phage shock protein C (PspC) family protein n=1 Tax=Litorimonas taeanensis TaxID=568099 RepID=A0A420WDS2_9PROT|nr:PspC domain-containing protein [Litorimonas taeanensis]RKQ69167.1 phage shock protein C (PspC) family protein [Litorimonas taeanensis]